jgi:hypothetical protein
MFAVDIIAGDGPHDRTDDQSAFTGASGDQGLVGLGGQAEPPTNQAEGARAGAPGTLEPGTVYERIGF